MHFSPYRTISPKLCHPEHMRTTLSIEQKTPTHMLGLVHAWAGNVQQTVAYPKTPNRDGWRKGGSGS